MLFGYPIFTIFLLCNITASSGVSNLLCELIKVSQNKWFYDIIYGSLKDIEDLHAMIDNECIDPSWSLVVMVEQESKVLIDSHPI